MLTATAVYLFTKFPNREVSSEDRAYLCYEDNSPIPWDKDVIFITDDVGRNWFCHELEGSTTQTLTQQYLTTLAHKIKAEHTPQTREALERRVKNPLVIKLVASRAESLDELRDLLSKADFKAKKK